MTTLDRRLGTGDAVVIGLAAMIGAGVFAVWAPAAATAGSGLLWGLGIAFVVALCNATASAQLAAAHPSSGGTYHFGREVLGPWWGFTAGWCFVVGKTASCAAMAMAFALYVLPHDAAAWWPRVVGVAAVAALTWANLRGITKTARLARLLVSVTLLVLVLAVVTAGSGPTSPLAWSGHDGALGALRSAGLLFFAFAGYARIATLAEEVRRPEMLGRAVLISLGITGAIYTVVAVVLLGSLGPDLATSPAPLATAMDAAGAAWAEPVVRVGAAAATLGALLGLLAGISRTMLAMARNRDLPAPLAAISPAHRVPAAAQLVIGLLVMTLVAAADLREAIGFSSFGVLLYYAITNLAALRQPPDERRWPGLMHVAGLVGCLGLAALLPTPSVIAGTVVVAVGLAARAWHRRG